MNILDTIPQRNYFPESACRCDVCKAGESEQMDSGSLHKFNQIREYLGIPLTCNSGKRCKNHPIERNKFLKTGYYAGQHVAGTAMDIKCSGNLRFKILKCAILLGATGIAFGDGFIHIDFREGLEMTWTY